MEDSASIPPLSAGRRAWLKPLIAWTGTIAIISYLALTTDFGQALRTFLEADHLLFVATAVFFTLLTWVTDAATARLVLKRSGVEVSFQDFVAVKGASYLLNMINYNLALALMAAVVGRRTGKGLAAAGSPFLLLNFVDLSAMSLMVVGAIVLGASPFESGATLILAGAAAGGLLAGPCACALARVPARTGWLKRLTTSDLLGAFRGARAGDLFAFVAARSVLIIEYILLVFCFLVACGFSVPLPDLFVFQPILGLVGFIPISIAGLGSTQVAAREFYAPFAPPGVDAIPAIDAYTTTSIVAVLLVRVVIAVACMPRATRMARSVTTSA